MKSLYPVLKTLRIRPKTANPAPRRLWPGLLNAKLEPVVKGNRSPLRLLVQYVNDQPLPRHPVTGRPLHLVRGCQFHKQCVNPYHIREVQVLQDDYETIKLNASYGYPNPLRYLWPDELKELSASCNDDEAELRILALMQLL